MEIRFQRILLKMIPTLSLLLLVGELFLSSFAIAEESSSVVSEVVKPVINRKQVFDDLLDNENFEVGIQAGIISIEDFESSLWLGAHFAYHMTENFYFKALYGQAKAGTSSFERLSNTAPLLTKEQRDYTYYGLNLGYNLMPGEIFLGKNIAFNSVFSIEFGAGTTKFTGDDNFTVNLSTNYRIFLNDWIAWDIGVSDYIFDTQITGITKTTHNLNFITGFSVYF